jgi:predicted RNA-binding Zn ribbon-like protein
MRIDHDSELALDAAVALVNTEDHRTGLDTLAAPDDLRRFLDERSVSGSRVGTDGELRAVRRLRRRLRAIFDASDARDRCAVVTAVNGLIAESGAVPRLVEHDGNPLHLHFTSPDAPVHHRLGAEIGVALAIVVRDLGYERLRVCEAPDCGGVLMDMSTNRSRRYCDTQCGNRQHVAAYRERLARARG